MLFIWLGQEVDEGLNVSTSWSIYLFTMHTLFALILKPKNIIFVFVFFFPWKQTKKFLLMMILQVLNMVFIIETWLSIEMFVDV